MTTVSSVKIPAYNFKDTALGFMIYENTFELGCLTTVTDRENEILLQYCVPTAGSYNHIHNCKSRITHK